MASALDSLVIVGPQYQEVFSGDMLITPAGGSQGRLADQLGGGSSALQAAGITSNATGALGTLPANAVILYVLLRETAGFSIDVGIGTASGGTQVAIAAALLANTSLTFPAAQLVDWFSATNTQPIFLSSASWGGASVNAKLVYQIGP